MNKLISYTVIALFATAALAVAATEKEDAIAREKAAWQAFKDKNADEFRKIFATSYRGIYSDGIGKAEDETKSMQEMTVKSFSLSDFDVVSVNPSTVLVTYKVNMQSTEAGKEESGTYNCASVWQKEGNDWRVIVHTNVKEEKPEGAKTSDS
ncbi:MAG: nuclear transport factor 2 family protein [Verrucomicrobiota bacterium]|nr:nuclear transport factor 2 family protein [Verrucomicrobiota bacterium]